MTRAERKGQLIIEAIRADRIRAERRKQGLSWAIEDGIEWSARTQLAQIIMQERYNQKGRVLGVPLSADYDAAYRLIRAYKALGVE